MFKDKQFIKKFIVIPAGGIILLFGLFALFLGLSSSAPFLTSMVSLLFLIIPGAFIFSLCINSLYGSKLKINYNKKNVFLFLLFVIILSLASLLIFWGEIIEYFD